MAWKTSFTIALAQLVIFLSPAHAIQIVEAFDTDTSDVTDGSYPDFTLTLGTGSVSGGVLQLGDGGLQRFTRPGLSGDLSVSGQIQSAAYGDWKVGMEFGNRRFVFSPGFEGGLFEIEDAELPTSALPPVTLLQIPDMGFTPSATAFHTMQLDWNQAFDQLTITVTDGGGIADPFHLAWTPDAAFDPNGRIGFVFFNGGGDPGPAFFDNLIIVPEPSVGFLVTSGLVLLAARRRWREKRELSRQR